MLDELRELYQEVILDHGRHPRNFHAIDDATCHARGDNPMCGDVLTLYLALDADGRIEDVSFVGKGCAISVASASLMTEIVKGKTKAEAEALFEAFHALCTEDDFDIDAAGVDVDALDRLRVMSGVREFPVRVKCATLAWHTMMAAMAGETETSTE